VAAYVAMLRGINVGGKNKIKMADLQALFVGLGHADVITYIQSGNVVFSSAGRDPRKLADEMEVAFLDTFGFGVEVVVRSADEMADIVAANPFVARRAHTKDLYVAFARDPIRGEPRVDRTYEPDEFCIAPLVVYMHTPTGDGNTKLSASVLQRVAGSSVTARNWNTVTKLAEMAAGRG
jgi:uncharacterized protein (DUF1697 family)